MWPICKIKILGKEMCFGKVKRKWKFYNILDFKFVDNFYYYYSLIGFFLPFNLKKKIKIKLLLLLLIKVGPYYGEIKGNELGGVQNGTQSDPKIKDPT
jgi:hypothetical protein